MKYSWYCKLNLQVLDDVNIRCYYNNLRSITRRRSMIWSTGLLVRTSLNDCICIDSIPSKSKLIYSWINKQCLFDSTNECWKRGRVSNCCTCVVELKSFLVSFPKLSRVRKDNKICFCWQCFCWRCRWSYYERSSSSKSNWGGNSISRRNRYVNTQYTEKTWNQWIVNCTLNISSMARGIRF